MARVLAESDLWTLIHLVIVLGIILKPVGLLAVRHDRGQRLHDGLTRGRSRWSPSNSVAVMSSAA